MLRLVIADSYDDLLQPFIDGIKQTREGLTPLQNIMMPEWVVSPSLGVRRWLTHETSKYLGASNGRLDGIVANWQHDFPGRVTQRVLDAHLRIQHGIETDPWALPQLQFSIYEWGHSRSDEPSTSLVKTSTGAISLARCRQLADLFDRYLTWRPEMVHLWLTGEYEGDSESEKLQADALVSLRHFVDAPTSTERWTDAWSWAKADTTILPATDRVSFFGLREFPGGNAYLDAMATLAEVMDVHVYIAHSFHQQLDAFASKEHAFSSDVLTLWGGALSTQADVIQGLIERGAELTTLSQDTHSSKNSLLGSLQTLLATDTSRIASSSDDSLIFHETHGEMRQAEILRDSIIHELALSATDREGQTSESEILVVVPKLEKFDNALRLAFGEPRIGSTNSQQPQLAYRISSRSLSHEGPYLSALRQLLAIIRSRCSRTEVLSLLAEPTIARSRNVGGDGEELFAEWAHQADIRWGLNRAHREQFGLAGLGNVNTWEAGLYRLSLGAMIENPRLRNTNGLLPVEVAPAHFDDYLCLLSAVSDLTSFITESWTTKSLTEWFDWYDRLVRAFVVHEPNQAREYERVSQALSPLRRSTTFTASPITLNEFLETVGKALDSIGSLGSLLTGGVTITTPEVLTGVSFDSIYVLGFDDDAFAASDWEYSDLRRLKPHLGDIRPSDAAKESLRQLILSARNRLTIIRNGREITTNAEIKPNVALSELLDAVGSVLPEKVRPITIFHPRNGFSPENFDLASENFADSLRASGFLEGPWSFSSLNFGLSSTRTRQSWVDRLVIQEFAATKKEVVALRELETLLKNPPEYFVRHTLGVSLPDQELVRENDLATDFAGLDKHDLLKTLWEEERAENDLRTVADLSIGVDALIDSGSVPPEPILNAAETVGLAQALNEKYQECIAVGGPRHIKGILQLSDGSLDVGVDVRDSSDKVTLVEVIISRLQLKYVIGPWLRAVAVRALTDRPLQIKLVYRSPKPDGELVKIFTHDITAPAHEAREALEAALRIYNEAHRRIIPFPAGEAPAIWEQPSLAESKWRPESKRDKSFSTPYLEDPYWELTMGHLSAADIMADATDWGFQAMLKKMAVLLDQVLPLFSFVRDDGELTSTAKSGDLDD